MATGGIKMTEWSGENNKMHRSPITRVVKLEGSYAEIDGERV